MSQQGQSESQALQLTDESRELISSMVSDIQLFDLVKQDWSTSLASAPVSISILGECMLVCSFNNASRIVIDHPGLQSKSLPTNLVEIVQMGSTAFIKAEIGMGRINTLSHRVSMSGGLVDRIVKYALKKPTPTTKKLFDIELNALKKASQSCADETKKILAQMEAWGQHVNKVWLALSEKDSAIYRQKLEKEEEQKKQRERERSLAAAAAQAKRALESKRDKFAQALKEDAQRTEDSVLYGPEIAAALTSITIISPLVGATMFGLTALGIWLSDPNTEEAEKLYEAQVREHEKARLDEQQLQQEIQALKDESKSLEEVKRTVARAIGKMVELHSNIRQLLLYFEGATKMVEDIHEHQGSEFASVLQIEYDPEEDEESIALLQTAMLEKAFQVKVHFASMHKVAEAYGDISHEFIIGGFDEINRLGLTGTSESEAAIKDKELQLKNFRSKYSQGVRQRTAQRQKELQTLLHSTVTQCAKGVLTIQNGR